jgi:FixH
MIAANAPAATLPPGTSRDAAPKPWYREPWPWLLMAGPAIVVVAGFLTLGFALQSADGLVADDYYKQGKAINQTLARDVQARTLGYAALLAATGDGRVVLSFAGASRNAVYTVGFFILWALCALACAISIFLQSSQRLDDTGSAS